eukprot:gb/GEZN01010984.1/.p1 GENE.gb/GEZN01010984.1/~~gb/GEZN01010984.1/.p1  ORF type:complete len:309 (-),score=24.14 gb/GEZN01010984.1/:84-1010(-)
MGIIPSDDDLGKSCFFRFFSMLYLPFAEWFHGYEVKGEFPTGGALLICLHTSHNQDIALNLVAFYAYTGRVVRAQIHRVVMFFNPWARYIGMSGGNREQAINLLKAGHLVACIPGGGEEAVTGHENAYRLNWESSKGNKRRGFAFAAKEANVPVVPVVTSNGEEMRWMPLIWIWNRLGLSRAYERLVSRQDPSSWVHWCLTQLRFLVWWHTCWLSIPIPVKVTVHLGDPIFFKPDESVDEFVDRCHEAMSKLIKQMNSNAPGTGYMRALGERFCYGEANNQSTTCNELNQQLQKITRDIISIGRKKFL